MSFENSNAADYWLESYKNAMNYNTIVSVADEKGIIIYVNEKFCEISGFTQEELIGKTHRLVNSGFHPKDFFAELWRTVKQGNTWRGEVKNKTKNGMYYWVDAVIIPVEIEKKPQYLSLRTVITERKNLEESRQNYLQTIVALIFITSHKMRGPLASILGLVQMENQSVTKEEFDKILSYVKTSAESLDVCIQEVNTYLTDLKNLNNK